MATTRTRRSPPPPPRRTAWGSGAVSFSGYIIYLALYTRPGPTALHPLYATLPCATLCHCHCLRLPLDPYLHLAKARRRRLPQYLGLQHACLHQVVLEPRRRGHRHGPRPRRGACGARVLAHWLGGTAGSLLSHFTIPSSSSYSSLCSTRLPLSTLFYRTHRALTCSVTRSNLLNYALDSIRRRRSTIRTIRCSPDQEIRTGWLMATSDTESEARVHI